MALQINTTTVVDDNKNIISGTPSTQGTIVKSTVSYLAPSGATGQRPTGAVESYSTCGDATNGTALGTVVGSNCCYNLTGY
jgi:hypothetical protein